MSYRLIVKLLLYVAVFFLFVLIVTIILFSTAWSTSGKCSTSCDRIINSLKKSEDDHPDESWAEIPDELYSFFKPPPRFPSKDAQHKCESNETLPPIGIVFYVDHTKNEDLGIAAALVRRWVLMRSYKLLEKNANNSHKYVRFNSKHLSKGGEVIRVARIVHYKLLAALYLEHPINSDCMQFAALLADNGAISTFTSFVFVKPTLTLDPEITNQTYTRENATSESTCSPLFINPNNAYILCGFIKCWKDEPVKEPVIFQKDNEPYHEWIETL